MFALAVPVYFLPATRDELTWWWAESHGHSDNYLTYLSDWPEGRHAAGARLLCEQRRWAETKRAEIRTADTMALMASPSNADSEAKYRREKELRHDNFLWKQTTHENTLFSYRDYLNQYPSGLHSSEARQKIQALGGPPNQTNAPRQ